MRRRLSELPPDRNVEETQPAHITHLNFAGEESQQMIPETQRNQVDSENSGSSYKDDKSEGEIDDYSSEASYDTAVCVNGR